MDHVMKLSSPECGAEIPADNINLDRMVAKCRECNTVFGEQFCILLYGMIARHT